MKLLQNYVLGGNKLGGNNNASVRGSYTNTDMGVWNS